jgi:hypothetical protein
MNTQQRLVPAKTRGIAGREHHALGKGSSNAVHCYDAPMTSPAWVRRRPFLMPIGVVLALAVLAACALVMVAWWLMRSPALQVIVIPVGAAASEGRATMDLTARAELIARLWGARTSGSGIEAIYIDDSREERQLAAPLAQRLNITPREATQTGAALATRVLRERVAERILIMAPSASVPELLEGLGGEGLRVAAAPDEMFILAIPRFGRTTCLSLSDRSEPGRI